MSTRLDVARRPFPVRVYTGGVMGTSAAYVFVLWRLEVPWVWIAVWVAWLLLLALAPRRPVLALGTYAATLYGTPRYSSLFDKLSQSNLLHVEVALAVAATALWLTYQERHPLVHKSKLLFLVAAAAAWLIVSALVPRDTSILPEEAIRHSPWFLIHCAVLLGIASVAMSVPTAILEFVAPFGAALVVRGLWQGIDGIRYEGDIGPLSVMLLPLSLALCHRGSTVRGRVGAGGLAVVLLLFVALTYNRAAAVALAATLAMLTWQYRRHVVLLTFVLLAGVLGGRWLMTSPYAHRFERAWVELTGRASGSVSERLMLWKAGRAMTLDHPVFGVGIGRFPSQLARYAPRLEGKEAHNSYVHMAAETGIPGLVLYVALFLGALGSAGILAWRRSDDIGWMGAALQASLVGYLAAGFFISRHDMVLAYICVGWILALQSRAAQDRVGRDATITRSPSRP